MEAYQVYQTPLSRSIHLILNNLLALTHCAASRYASKEMSHLFSPAVRHFSPSIIVQPFNISVSPDVE
jgi:hypothetical protein